MKRLPGRARPSRSSRSGRSLSAASSAAVEVYDSPKPPAERVSLGLEFLRQSRYRIILTSGQGKRDIIRRIKAGEEFPVTKLGDIHWFIDEAANT